ncbi:MAG: TetR/AcrR family transcriptional regulator [Desulfobacteraceae bacterium]|nr:MAG: TetR/AcrR family transcriptional regulator [Desulfobacteraceae bacterium]
MPIMRTKDENKKEALFRATIKLVNEIGFASSSVSKIAKEANVSPSTLYVFFDNKEDLLVSTYVEIKTQLAHALLENFDDTLPIRDIIRNGWYSVFNYVSEHPDEAAYMEQFSNSPYSELVDKAVVEREFVPFGNVMVKGIEQKIIKDVDISILAAFIFNPLFRLANPRLCAELEMNEEKLEQAFGMAWDAIKL